MELVPGLLGPGAGLRPATLLGPVSAGAVGAETEDASEGRAHV